jgi:hypothetical protein
MKSLQWLVVLALVALVPACGGAKTTVDYDRDADFSKYRTYAYEKGTPADNQLIDQRIVAALENQMKAEGFQKVDSTPQVYATYHVSTQDKKQFVTDSTGYGYGPGWRWGGGMGTSTTRQIDYTVGTLVVDLWDASTKKLVWRGTASKTLEDDPSKSTKNINDAMAKIFKDYPPGQRD